MLTSEISRLVLCLLLAVPLAAPARHTPPCGPAVNLSNLPGRSTYSTLAYNPAGGDVWAVWTEGGMDTWEEIAGRRWSSTHQMWWAVENLSMSPSWARDGGPAIAFDGEGHGLLVWTRTYSASQGAPTDGHDVLWRAWDGSTWSPEEVLLHGQSYLPGSPGVFDLILLRTTGAFRLFILWGNGYRTADYRDGAWSEVAGPIYLDVQLSRILPDEGGGLVAAAYGPNSAQYGYNRWFHDAYYLTYDGTAWSEPINLSGTDGVAADVGLVRDGQGRLHFLWSDPDSPFSDESLKSAIWERIYDGGTWSPNTEVTAYNVDQAINGFALASDISGTLHLAWSEGLLVAGAHTELDLYYQEGDGTAWGPEQQVYTSTAASRYPALALGANGGFFVWEEVFNAGQPVPDHEVYAMSPGGTAPFAWRIHLPIVPREAPGR
jgi:hypothetical protein